MSHNRIKIGTAEPDALGVISPALTDCSDVLGTPSDGQILQYSPLSRGQASRVADDLILVFIR